MNVDRRICIFKFKATDFQTNCLPYPKSVISAIDGHMPEIAISRNEKLQETMRVFKKLKYISKKLDFYFTNKK
jgi:hypothetical protein